MGILLVPGIVQDIEADHNRDLLPIEPSNWVSESNCGPSNSDCRGVVFPQNSLLIFEKHHDPGDLYKVEIFINKGDCQNNYYSPNNCSSADPDEIFSRWNLEGKSGSVSCVSGMTMWGNEYNESGKTEGLDGPVNSVCNGTITVNKISQSVYRYSIDTSMLPDAEHEININSRNSATSNYVSTYKISTISSADTSKTLTITNLSVGPAGDWYAQNAPQLPSNHTRLVVSGTQTGMVSGLPVVATVTDTSTGNIIGGGWDIALTQDAMPVFGFDAALFYYNGQWQTEYNGNFKLELCQHAWEVCTEQNFTVSTVPEASSDTTPPTITVPTNINISTTDSSGWQHNLDYSNDSTGPRATDNLDVTSFSCNFPSNNYYSPGTTTVTCTALDEAGNQATNSFTVTVNYMPSDNIPPTFSSFIGGTFAQPHGWDTDPETKVEHQFIPAYGGASSPPYPHPHTLTQTPIPTQYVTTDNTSGFDYSFSITALDGFYHWGYSTAEKDNQGFRNNSSQQLTGLSCSGLSGLQSYGTGGGSHVVNQMYYGFFPLGTTTIACTATDVTGNVATTSFDVVVSTTAFVDTTPPVVNVPNDLTFTTTTDSRTISVSEFSSVGGTFPPSAVDDVDGTVNASCAANSSIRGGNFANFIGTLHPEYWSWENWPVDTTTVTCTATDAAGNAGSASFTITVNQVALDTTPPTINIPSDIVNGITLTASDSSGAVIGGSAMGNINSISASDNVGIADYRISGTESFLSDWSATSGYSGGVWCNNDGMWNGEVWKVPIGNTTITCKAWDTSENESTASFTITVTPPQYTIEFTSGSAYNTACGGTNSCMNPYQLDIPVNSEVRFMNNDNAIHMTISGNRVSGASGHWESGIISAYGGSFHHTFTESGTYEYYDTIHQHIKGKIVVGGDSTVKTGIFTDTIPPVIDIQTQTARGNLVSDGPDYAVVNYVEGYSGSFCYEYYDSCGQFAFMVHATDNVGITTGPFCHGGTGWTIPMSGGQPYSYSQSPEGAGTDPALPVGTSTITCTATDAAGNTGTDTFDVTINPPQTTSNFATIETGTKPGIGGGPIETCIGWENLPSGTQSIWLLGPSDGTYSVHNYDGKQWKSGSHNFQIHGTPSGHNHSCYPQYESNNFSGEYQYVALSHPTIGYYENNSLFLSSIIEWSTPVNLIVPSQTTSIEDVYFYGVDGLSKGDTNNSVTRTALNSTGYTLNFGVGPPDFSIEGELSNLTCSTETGNLTLGAPLTMGWGYQENAFAYTFPIGTTTVTCTGTDSNGATGTNSVTVTVLPQTNTSLGIYASAYLNSSSPTGRTLQLNSDFSGLSNDIKMITQTITKDGKTYIAPFSDAPFVSDPEELFNMESGTRLQFLIENYSWYSCIKSGTFTMSDCEQPGDWTPQSSYKDSMASFVEGMTATKSVVAHNWFGGNHASVFNDGHIVMPIQTSIPENWPAGTYTITWKTHEEYAYPLFNDMEIPNNFIEQFSTTVTIPALQSTLDTTPPIITLEGPPDVSSSQQKDRTTFYVGENSYQADDGIQGIRGSSITSKITATVYDDGKTWGPTWDGTGPNDHNNQMTEIQTGDPYITNCSVSTPIDDISYSDVWDNVFNHFDHPEYYPRGENVITCTATDAAGNIGTASITLTVIHDCSYNYCPDETQTTPSNIVEYIQGSSIPGCEPDCVTPSAITIGTGMNVTFANRDSTAHTSTSGTSDFGPSGHWDSSLVMGGKSYTSPALEQGTYHYYCIIHPWIDGKVTVGNGFPLRTTEPIVEVIDITPPNIITPNSVTISVTNSTGGVVTYPQATASDNKEIDASPYCFPHSGSIFPVGVTKVSCSVTDKAGNTATKTFDVTVINSMATGDIMPPKISQLNMITVDATTANGAVIEYKMPTATDDTAVTYGPVCTPKSGSFFEIGSNTVTCIAKDEAGNQGSVAFLVKVDSKIAIPKEVKTSVSVNVGKEQYQNDEAIFITGSANPSSKEKVSLEIRDSLSNLVGIEQADVEEFGSYTAIVFPSQLWNVNGTYSMTAMYGSSQDSADFDFLILPETTQQTPIAITPTQLNIKQFSPGVFDAGEIIEISADMNAGTGHSIILSVEGPGGQLLLQPLNTDSSGTVNLNFALSDELVTGTYTINAKSTGEGYDLTDALEFTVIALIPELTVNEVIATTESGIQATQYDAGELAYFATNLTTETTTPVLVTVNVFDSQGNTLGVGFFKSTIGEGDSEIVLGFELPDDIISGVAEVYTNVFTDWPDQGGVPITDEIKASVQLIGVEPTVVEIPESIIDESESIVNVTSVSPTVGTTESPQLSESECQQLAIEKNMEDNDHIICEFPFDVVVKEGERVAWIESKPWAGEYYHTITSVDGLFDMTDMGSTSFLPSSWGGGGIYEYYDKLNPSLTGKIIVTADVSDPSPKLVIQNVPGSAAPGCEPNCFVPSNGAVNPGGTAIWENNDSAAHTITSGTPANGPDGIFDSGLIMPNQSFSYTFDIVDVFDYYCMVHPWMIGKITVTGADVSIENENEIESQQEEIKMKEIDTTPIITDTISIASFANTPDCDIEKNCISPYHAQVTINQNVTWNETPFATHIVSGNSTFGPGGYFDFGVKINEKTIHAFNETGIFHYFDMMHPWIEGTITVTIENFLLHLYNILQTQLLLPSALAVTEFPIITDSDSYKHGQVVKISGITSEENISLQVKDPSGKTVLIRTLPAEGNFSYEIGLPNYFKVGEYNIFASVTIDNIPKIVSKSIYLLDEDGEVGPIHTSSINVIPESSEEQTQSSEEQTQSSEGGGCLIATAAFGSEMAPQVQFLREIRDNTVMNTQSGTIFMTGFNQFYYSFSPYVADYQRENPVFKEAVKVTLTPLLTSLTLLNHVEIDSDGEMLGYGLSIILLNVGMYFVAPASLILIIKRRFRK